MIISGWFYDPAFSGQAWWLERHRLGHYLFYESVPIVSALIPFAAWPFPLLGSLRRFAVIRDWRGPVLYVLLVFVLGSGLLVNAVFKDHWGRARPVDVSAFGGAQPYTPPGQYVADGEGRSFPSGHSSIGFGFVAFWFLWRQRRPLWARRALGFALIYGSLIGLTRMAAGGHFLSHVLWSWIMGLVAWDWRSGCEP
ncbi:MAG: phosphatase PAP2 family protein [Thiolinea sp.]